MKVDLYESDNEEIIWLEDGVCVNQQKPRRNKVAKSGRQRTTTDSVMLRTPAGGYVQVVAAMDIDLTALCGACLRHYFTGKQTGVVVISDGSRTIKNRCSTLFGNAYVHILDWYHLQRKVRDLMTMIAPDKTLKSAYCEELLGLLWQGKAMEALLTLQGYKYRNKSKWEELIGYLSKNESHLIDYKRRYEAGKLIGSGRMEKAGYILVARRQKEKGMTGPPVRLVSQKVYCFGCVNRTLPGRSNGLFTVTIILQ